MRRQDILLAAARYQLDPAYSPMLMQTGPVVCPKGIGLGVTSGLLVAGLLVVPPLAAQRRPVWVEREIYVMGTWLRVTVQAADPNTGARAIEAAFGAVQGLDAVLSTWRDDSELSRVNASVPGVPLPLSDALYALLREAREWSTLTEGAFDPGLGSLVTVWDLRGAGRRPAAPEIQRALDASGIGRFTFDDARQTVTRPDSASWIDSGGFGKGAALRAAAAALRDWGVGDALLDFGGQLLALGSSPDAGLWSVGVAHPSHRSELAARLRLTARSVATTSQSERWVEVDGQRLGHVLDPRTGWPLPAWGSVTVVAADPMVADLLSTALFVLGPERGMGWAADRDDLGVLFLVERDGGVTRRWNRGMTPFLSSMTTASPL